MTWQTEKHTDGSHMALHSLHTYAYMETSYAPHIKTLPHDPHFPKMESIPKILVALTPASPYEENPCIPKIKVSSTSLYKQQASSIPRYAKNP